MVENRAELLRVLVEACQPGKNIRQSFDPEEIRLLGASLLKRQIHPIILTRDYQVIDGGKRLRAAQQAGLKELLAVVTDEVLSPEQITEWQVVAAFHRSDPKNFDKWQAMEAVKAAHAEWTNKQLAEHLDIDAKMVKILLSPGPLRGRSAGGAARGADWHFGLP